MSNVHDFLSPKQYIKPIRFPSYLAAAAIAMSLYESIISSNENHCLKCAKHLEGEDLSTEENQQIAGSGSIFAV